MDCSSRRCGKYLWHRSSFFIHDRTIIKECKTRKSGWITLLNKTETRALICNSNLATSDGSGQVLSGRFTCSEPWDLSSFEELVVMMARPTMGWKLRPLENREYGGFVMEIEWLHRVWITMGRRLFTVWVLDNLVTLYRCWSETALHTSSILA